MIIIYCVLSISKALWQVLYRLSIISSRQLNVKEKVKSLRGVRLFAIPWPWGSPGKNTGVGCRFLLQKIFLTQGSNPGLLHCRQALTVFSMGIIVVTTNSDTFIKFCLIILNSLQLSHFAPCRDEKIFFFSLISPKHDLQRQLFAIQFSFYFVGNNRVTFLNITAKCIHAIKIFQVFKSSSFPLISSGSICIFGLDACPEIQKLI